MEIQGKIVKILDAQKFVSQKNGNEYVKNTFILETQGQYPKTIAFSVMGADKFNAMNIAIGGTYTVSFDVESREWNGKYFTECSAWKAVNLDAGQSAQTQQPEAQAPTAAPAPAAAHSPQPAPANGVSPFPTGGNGNDSPV